MTPIETRIAVREMLEMLIEDGHDAEVVKSAAAAFGAVEKPAEKPLPGVFDAKAYARGIMKYGKYAGYERRDVPRDYLEYIHEENRQLGLYLAATSTSD